MIDEKTFEIINRIAKDHSAKTFGYLKQEDLKNEIWIICLEILQNYDYSRGELENFLRFSVKNRLINKFKDITKSVRSPCPRCPYFFKDEDPTCAKFSEDQYQCDKWRNYQLSVDSRNSLLNASESTVERQVTANSINSLVSQESQEILAKNIDPKYKRDFEQLVSGGKLSKQKFKKLKREIERVLIAQEGLVQITINRKVD